MKYEMFDLLGAFNREGTFLGDPKQSPKGKFRAYFFLKKGNQKEAKMRLCVEQYGLLGLPDPIPKDFEFKVNNRLDLNDKIVLLVGGAITT